LLYRVLYEQLELKRRQRQYPWPTKVGLDEHFFKWHKSRGFRSFVTMVVDHKNHRLMEVVDGKQAGVLRASLSHIDQRHGTGRLVPPPGSSPRQRLCPTRRLRDRGRRAPPAHPTRLPCALLWPVGQPPKGGRLALSRSKSSLWTPIQTGFAETKALQLAGLPVPSSCSMSNSLHCGQLPWFLSCAATLLVGATACAASTSPPAQATAATAPTASATAAAGPGASPEGSTPAPGAVNAGVCPTQLLLDDLEDGDTQIVVADQRDGSWYTYADDKGSTIEPAAGGAFRLAEGGAQDSKFAARMAGKTAEVVGGYVGMGFDFTSKKDFYDLSCCKAISFWGKKVGRGTGTVRVKIGDSNTEAQGGVCKDCSNNFGMDYGFTEEWKQYTLPFDRLYQQPYWGDRFEGLVSGKVLHLHFQVNHPNFDYDIWVDDVRLVGCGVEAASPGG
jgi:hypothetical protein